MKKAFTDLEQSKALSGILPIESADMMWDDWSLINEGWKLSVGYYPEIEKDYGRKCYPAWSLTALLDFLPNNIGRYTKALYWFDDALHCEYIDEVAGIFCTSANNALDACYDMIIKLYERKKLL